MGSIGRHCEVLGFVMGRDSGDTGHWGGGWEALGTIGWWWGVGK